MSQLSKFICGERFYSDGELKDLKNWIDEILSSNGNRNEKAYEAKDKLQKLFSEIIHSAIRHNNLEVKNGKRIFCKNV